LAASLEDSEEIGLAPLEEEKSDELADPSEMASSTDNLTSATAETVAGKPRRSLVEEALEQESVQEEEARERFQIKAGEIDPLRPPGFSGPSYGTPTWVYVVASVGILVLLGIIGVMAVLP
jgi:hypothetical protein